MKRIHDMADGWARCTPERIAVIDYDGFAYTFADLKSASLAAADCLSALDVKPGDRVMLVAENSFAAISFALAVSRLDAWVVPVNARMTAHEIGRVRDHADPAAIVFTHVVSPEADRHADASGALEATGAFGSVRIEAISGSAQEPVDADPHQQVAVLFYTTGTTGDPKGVMLTHANLLHAGRVSAEVRGCSHDDVVLCAIPMTHVFGFVSVGMAALSAGATMRLMDRFDEEGVLAALAQDVTYFPAVPMMHARIIDHARRNGIEKPDAPKLKYISAGGAPLDLDWKLGAEAFYGLTLNNGYGITETSAGIATTLPQAPVAGTEVGPVMPGHEVRIVPAGSDGDVGEILIRGANVMKGYYKAAQETAAALDTDGFFHTGDLGRLHPGGTLEIVGRSKELIIRSGFNVYPPEVEAALTTHPSVLIAAVIGHPQADGNEAVLAFIEQVPGAQVCEAELKAHAGRLIAPYKVPSHIFVADDMPRAATGKILKSRLATQYAERIASTLA